MEPGGKNYLRFFEMNVDNKDPPSCSNANLCVSLRVHLCICVCVLSCLTVARRWHAADPRLACGCSLFYSPRGDRRVTVCVCGCSLSRPDHRAHRWSTATRSFQHRPPGKKKPPFTVVRSVISMVWKTDVFYVEKYTFHSMECLHWQSFLTSVMAAVCHCY